MIDSLSHLHDVLFLPFEIAADYILPLSASFFFFSPRIYSLCSFQGTLGGLKWTRTTDLTLIRRAL